VLGFAVGAIFLALAFWGVPPRELLDAVLRMDPFWLLPMAGAFVAQELLRSVRQLLLLRPVLPDLTFRRSTSVIFIGFFCVHTFPLRLGELARPLMLRHKEGLPMPTGLAMVVALRSLDLLAALCMLLLVLVTVDVPATMHVGSSEVALDDMLHGLGWGLVLPALAFTLGLAFFGAPLERRVVAPVLRALERTGNPLLGRVAHIGTGLVARFTEGLSGLRDGRVMVAALALTAAIWASACAMYWMTAQAFDLGHLIGWPEALGVMVVTMVGSMLPAPPGMAGVQEAFGRGGLALFGVRGGGMDPIALAYAIIVHWYQVLLQTVGALIFIRSEGLTPRALLAMVSLRGERDEASPDA